MANQHILHIFVVFISKIIVEFDSKDKTHRRINSRKSDIFQTSGKSTRGKFVFFPTVFIKNIRDIGETRAESTLFFKSINNFQQFLNIYEKHFLFRYK